MEVKNKKIISIKFCIYLILAVIFLWPNFLIAQEAVTLSPPSPDCSGSEAFVNLNWVSTITGTPTYFVLRKFQGEPDTSYIEITSTTDTFYLDRPILSDKNYVYQIKAVRGADTFYSLPGTALAPYCPPVLSPPVTSCAADGPHISLSWSSVSGNLSIPPYEIYRDGIKIDQTSNTNFSDGPNIEATKTYNYFIRAIWQDGTPTDSDSASVLAPACPPTLTATVDCATTSPGGPKVNLSWNNLLGVKSYQIYRKAPTEDAFSLLATLTPPTTTYPDNLVESLPNTYYQGGTISYYVQAIWETAQAGSSEQQKQITIPRCSPYLKVETNCDEFSYRLSWTATRDATKYNIYKNGSFYAQNLGITNTSFIDGICAEKICTTTYQVIALDAGINLPSNAVEKFVDCVTVTPPSPAPVLTPPDAYCTAGDSRIKVSWTPSENVTYYGIYRNNVNIVNLIETSYEDSGVESGIEYTYFVVAYGKGGSSTTSNSQIITAVDCTPPSTPTLNLSTACTNGQSYINLTWSSTTNTFSYDIYRGPSATNLTLLRTFNKNDPEFFLGTWKDTGVLPSTIFYYKVVSNGPSGVPSSSSDIKAITTYSCLPTTPSLSLSKACEAGNPVVNLSWTTNGANTTRYEVYRKDYSETTSIWWTSDISKKNWKDTSVSPKTTYNYKVEAVGYLDTQRSTQGYKPITTDDCSVPGAFTLDDPTVYCQGSYPRADLSWSPSSNYNYYNLYRYRLNPDNSIAETTTFSSVTSPFIDWGFVNALRFYGDDFVDLGNPAVPLTGNLTIEFWARPSNVAYGRQNPICKAYGGEFCLTMETNGSLSYYHGSAGGNDWPYMSFNTTNIFANNTWVHVVITRDISTRIMRSYKNGAPVSSTTWESTYDPSSSPLTLMVGRGYVYDFRGIIDEVRIYDRVLNASEISNHYKSIYTNETGLIGLWHFDEGSGQIASDSSNYGNNGTLGSTLGSDTNDPTWVQNGLQSGTKYKWKVRAVGSGGSTDSNTTSPYTMPMCPPTKPGLVLTSLCEVLTGLPAVNLKWSYTTSTTKYEIYRQDKGLIKTINQGESEFSSRIWKDNNEGSGLSQEMSYTYWIKAIGSGGGTESDHLVITTPNCGLPTQPQNLTATFECNGSYPQIKLTWEDSQNATYYEIYRDDGWISDPITDDDSPIYTYYNIYPSVQVNTAYTYTVKAFGPGGESPLSNPTSTPVGNYCSPSTPSITFLIADCESLAPINNIYWSDDTPFNTSRYEIYRNSTTPPPRKTINQGDPEFSSRTWKDNSGLSPSTSYTYWVKTIGPAGETPFSASQSIATYYCGTPPTSSLNLDNLFCKDNLPYTTLSWTTSPNAYSYNLYRTNPDNTLSTYSTRLSPSIDKGGFALKFDGVNDYVKIENAPKLNYFDAGLTVEAWGKQTSYTGGADSWLLDKDYTGYRIWGYDRLRFGIRTPTQGWIMIGNTQPTLNTWYHLVGVVDNINLKMYLYVNGQLNSSADLPEKYNFDNWDLPLMFGRHNTANLFWPGVIDEVRIYGRALNPTEVNKHYQGIYKNETELRGGWHFDEGEGVTAFDSSGYGNNGKIAGPEWVSGKVGGALEFGGLNGYVEVPHSASLDIMTFEAWFNSKEWKLTNNWSSTILNKYTDSNNMYRIAFDDTQLGRIAVSAKKAGVEIGRNGKTATSLDTWHHLVVIFTNPVKIYLDKTDITSGNSNTWTRYTADNKLYIGSRKDGGYSNGLIDEVRIYNRVLSSTEITEHYNSIFNDESGLVGLWHFDEVDGTTARDSSGFDNHGTLIKGAEWITPSIGDPTYVSALENEKLYKYYVKAFGVDTQSFPSNEISFNISCLPAKPSKLECYPDICVKPQCVGTDSQLILSWDPDQNTEYWVIHKSGVPPKEITTTLTSYTDSYITSGAAYTYYVTAWGKNNRYTDSNLVTETAISCYEQPYGGQAFSISATSACYGYSVRNKVEWLSDQTGKTISYNIWRKNVTLGEADFSTTSVGIGPTATTWFDINATETQSYLYKVEAVGSGEGNTVFSDPSLEVTSLACSTMPPKPPDLKNSNPVSTGDLIAVTLYWKDVGNADEYRLFRSGSVWTEIAWFEGNHNPATSIGHTDYTISDDKTYEYKAIAYNMNTEPTKPGVPGTESNTVSVYIPIAKPGEFTLSGSREGNKIHLTWTVALTTEAGGPVTYEIWRSSSGTFSSYNVIYATTTPVDFPADATLECYDNSPMWLEKYYKAVATNNGGSTDSNILLMTLLVPIWKEIAPF